MTQVFKRDQRGPATHAFVIGVGSYPSAKRDCGVLPALQGVKDISSAADGAKLMCDWLIKNADQLAAPLASLELLISDTAEQRNRYAWTQQGSWTNGEAVDTATSANVRVAGARWLRELTARPGDVALFYACGHGAGLQTQPVVFLSDLNENFVNPWAHHNIGMTAASFRQLTGIAAGYFFSDTCREFVTQFELSGTQDDSRFIAPPKPFISGSDKIALLCGASEALLAYESPRSKSDSTQIGRFTQTLIRGLNGASARRRDGHWSVHPSGLMDDMKLLERAYNPDWRAKPFEPSYAITQNEVFPIINYQPGTPPLLPVVVLTDPEDAMMRFDVGIGLNDAGQQPWLHTRPGRSPGAWPFLVQAGLSLHYAVAEDAPTLHVSEPFVPNMPIFDQRIRIR